tara:strand:+ start:413 stop:601 length:189 start_codon:yes stop_codon:yes gene_type:complete
MEPVDVSKKHFYLSMIKSLMRLAACYILFTAGGMMDNYAGDFVQLSAFLLAAAEGIGILEEL